MLLFSNWFVNSCFFLISIANFLKKNLTVWTPHEFWSVCSHYLGQLQIHCVKSVQIRSFLWSEYRKIRTRKNSVLGHFHALKCLGDYRFEPQGMFSICLYIRNIHFIYSNLTFHSIKSPSNLKNLWKILNTWKLLLKS